jgi:hypothetical protein
MRMPPQRGIALRNGPPKDSRMDQDRDPTSRTAPADSTAVGPPRLLPSLREAIRVRHYSLRTEQIYVHWVRRFVHFHGLRHPRELGAAEVEAFLTHLAAERNVAPSTQGQAKSALLFLYCQWHSNNPYLWQSNFPHPSPPRSDRWKWKIDPMSRS